MSLETAVRAIVTSEIEALRQEAKVEFNAVHQTTRRLETDVSKLKTDVSELKTDVSGLKKDVSELKTDASGLKTDVGEMKVTMRQMEIRARNSRLKNPIARIRPVPVFIQGRGAEEPSPDYFPKYADQFYSLRKPQTERDYQMLAYLSKFYDIQLEAADVSRSGEEVQVDPERAVELLGERLGLDENNFIAFRARAQQFATQGPLTAGKRDWPITDSAEGPQPHRRRLQTPSDGLPTIPFTETPSRAPGRPAPVAGVPSHGSPTVPFTETPSRAGGRRMLADRVPSNSSPTVPSTKTPSHGPERLSNFHTVTARPRCPSTVPDSEETASG